MATIGSSYWLLTLAVRILCFLLALYAFGIFGYITANIVTDFIGKEPNAESRQGNAISASNDAVKEELAARSQLGVLISRFEGQELSGDVIREARVPPRGEGSSSLTEETDTVQKARPFP